MANKYCYNLEKSVRLIINFFFQIEIRLALLHIIVTASFVLESFICHGLPAYSQDADMTGTIKFELKKSFFLKILLAEIWIDNSSH